MSLRAVPSSRRKAGYQLSCPWSGFPVLRWFDRLKAVDEGIERKPGAGSGGIGDMHGLAAENDPEPRHAGKGSRERLARHAELRGDEPLFDRQPDCDAGARLSEQRHEIAADPFLRGA